MLIEMNTNKSYNKNNITKKQNVKKIILTAVGSIVTVSVSIFGFKYFKKIKPETVNQVKDFAKPIIDSTVNVAKDLIPKEKIKDALDKSSVIKLTATELGNKAFMTPQQINKKLVESGFMTKINGEYKLTELGKLFGKVTEKMTAAGHWFTNIEWRDGVLDLILSTEEWNKVNKTREIFEK